MLPGAQQSPACTEAHGSVRAAFPPLTKVSRGKKNIQANKQRKRGESRGWSQSNQLPPPKAEEESQAGHTEKSWRMNGHVEYMFPEQSAKSSLGPCWHTQASSMSFSPFASSLPLPSLSLSPSSSAPSVYVSFCP